MEYQFSDRVKNLQGNAIREIFKLLSDPEMISFAGGFPTLTALPVEEIQSITNELLSSASAYEILQYGSTEGYAPFIKTMCRHLTRYGIENLKSENLLIISGGQQAIDLTMKAFINKGDTVLVEDPTYLACLHILKTYEGNAVGVKESAEGLDLNDLEEKIKTHRPKLLYVVPTFSNPTGLTYTQENRKAIAELTAKYGVVVLEDDPYSELRYRGERVPALKSFDKAGNVLYTTSFSKTIAPGLRTGVVCGSAEIIRKLTIGKQAVDVHTSNLSQAIVDAFLNKGFFEKRLTNIIPLYKQKKDAMIAAIKKYFPPEIEFTDPDGGLFIWCSVQSLDTQKIFAELCTECHVAYVSGESFFSAGMPKNSFRLNYSNADMQQIEKGIAAMGGFLKKKLSEVK